MGYLYRTFWFLILGQPTGAVSRHGLVEMGLTACVDELRRRLDNSNRGGIEKIREPKQRNREDSRTQNGIRDRCVRGESEETREGNWNLGSSPLRRPSVLEGGRTVFLM